jgi:hypothetical protein
MFMRAQIAARSGRDANDFETRVTVTVMVAAAMEVREWLRRDGKGTFITLVNQALDQREWLRRDGKGSFHHAGQSGSRPARHQCPP